MTGGMEEGVCSSQPRRENRSKTGGIGSTTPVAEAGSKSFRWHDLRHTFASRLRMKGAPLEDIADLLGHKSLATTRRYAHLVPNKLHAVVSLLGASDTKSDTSQNAVPAASLQVAVH